MFSGAIGPTWVAIPLAESQQLPQALIAQVIVLDLGVARRCVNEARCVDSVQVDKDMGRRGGNGEVMLQG